MTAVTNFLKKHWGTIIAIVGPVFVFLQPSLDHFVATHPKDLTGVVIASLVTMYNLKAPKDKQ